MNKSVKISALLGFTILCAILIFKFAAPKLAIPFNDLLLGIITENRQNNNGTDNGEKNEPSDKVDEIINSLNQEQMAGQLLMVGFDGKEPDYYVSRMLNLRHVGGVILFSRNIETKEQVTRLSDQLQEMSLTNANLPLFIAVDQEGGPVNRFKGIITECPDPSGLGKLSSNEVANYMQETAKELTAMGINVNLAPVLDVADRKSIMFGRSFGDDPNVVAEVGVAAINGYKTGGIIPCAKHFPGLGLAVQDTHATSTKINANLDSLYKRDLLPFRMAIQNGVEMILVTHAIYPALDANNPASLSNIMQTGILRDMLGYQGLILSDDLEMEASASEGSIGQNAVRAIQAGTDIVLVCHTPEKQKEAYDAILSAIKSGEISIEHLKETLRKIITIKLERE